MGTTWLPPFDATKEFVTAAPFRAAGIPYGKGFPFDKESVSERVLGQLYDQRKIVPADTEKGQRLLKRVQRPGKPVVLKPTPPPPPPPPSTPETEEADALEVRIEKLTAKYSHAQLLQRAADIPGVKKSFKKVELATALVKHDRDAE